MEIAGVRVYADGLLVKPEAQQKIRKIFEEIKTVTSSTDLGMRICRNGEMLECVFWANADQRPIGIYARGISLSNVLDTLQCKIDRECIKIKKAQFAKSVTNTSKRKNLAAGIAV